jgi:hypothetical protein|tara:strand:- start:314 stop:628 length:315 start_codon:yes stop_codon:yes gene_type:complete
MTPTLTTIVDTLGLGAAIGGAGTVNRAIARKLTSIAGGNEEGLGRKAIEFVIPAVTLGVAMQSVPASMIGAASVRIATISGSMALAEASAGAVRSGMTLFGFSK